MSRPRNKSEKDSELPDSGPPKTDKKPAELVSKKPLVDFTAPHLAALGLQPLEKRDWPEPVKPKPRKPAKSLGTSKRMNAHHSLGDDARKAAAARQEDPK